MKGLSKWICRLLTHLPHVSGLSSSVEAERKRCSLNNGLQARAPLSSCLESVPHVSCQIRWPGELSGISMFQLIRVVSRPFHRLEEGQTQSTAFIRLCAFQHGFCSVCACSTRTPGMLLLLPGDSVSYLSLSVRWWLLSDVSGQCGAKWIPIQIPRSVSGVDLTPCPGVKSCQQCWRALTLLPARHCRAEHGVDKLLLADSSCGSPQD